MADQNSNNQNGMFFEPTNFEELDFEQMMEQRLQANFAGSGDDRADPSNERLREMNKKLPAWSLEPPYSFIRQ